jgi:hypothetical protein
VKVLGTQSWNIGDLILRYPQTNADGGGGQGTGVLEAPPAEPAPTPAEPARPLTPPVQKFTQADLDTAASTARIEERERVRGRHAGEITKKDEQIAQLTSRVEGLESEITAYEQSIRDDFAAMQDQLPEWAKPFAPGADASGTEIKAFMTRLRKAQEAGNPNPAPPPYDPANPMVPPPAPPVPPSPPPAPTTPQGPITVADEIAARRAAGGRRL